MRNLIITIALCAISLIACGDNAVTDNMSVKERLAIMQEKARQRIAERKARWDAMTLDEKKKEHEKNMRHVTGDFARRIAREISHLERFPNSPKVKSIEIDYNADMVTVTFSDGSVVDCRIYCIKPVESKR